MEIGAGEGNRILSENSHNSLNCPITVHCKRHGFHHLRIKRHGDDQTLMQIDASANVISRPCALVRSYHNPANLRAKTEILSGPPERARSVKASASGIGVHEVLTSGAGLGWREAQRRGKGAYKPGTRGPRCLVSQTERPGVERSPICEGPDAQSERSETEHRNRSKWASKRNGRVFRLSDKLESGAA